MSGRAPDSGRRRTAKGYFGPALLPGAPDDRRPRPPAPRPQRYRNEIWLLRGGRLRSGAPAAGPSARHDLMPASTMNSDVTIGAGTRLVTTSADGACDPLPAPMRIGDPAPVAHRAAEGALDADHQRRAPHFGFRPDPRSRGHPACRVHAIRRRQRTAGYLAFCRAGGTPRRLRSFQLPAAPRRSPSWTRLTALNRGARGDERPRGQRTLGWRSSGPLGPGWAPRRAGRRSCQIHGGPHTLYGWAPIWEFQVLAGAGMSVAYANPRGSEGYGRAFNEGNINDWGDGPTRDVARAASTPSSRTGWPTAIGSGSPAARTAATSRAGSSATTSDSRRP